MSKNAHTSDGQPVEAPTASEILELQKFGRLIVELCSSLQEHRNAGPATDISNRLAGLSAPIGPVPVCRCSPSPMLCKLRQFSGKSETGETWAHDAEKRMSLSEDALLPDDRKIICVSSFFTHDALAWHHSLPTSNPDLLLDYPGYMAALRIEFLHTGFWRRLWKLKFW